MKKLLTAAALCGAVLIGSVAQAQAPNTTQPMRHDELVKIPVPSVIYVDRLPLICGTDSDCDNMATEFGCEYDDDDDVFACDARQFRRALERHSS
jgi:hypothetical protein